MYCPNKALAQDIIHQYGSPVFLTDAETIRNRLQLLKTGFGDRVAIYYAIKANCNPEIIKVLKDAGINGIDTVSPLEIEWARKLGFSNDQIIFTGNNSSSHELSLIHTKYGVLLNIGSLSELKRFAATHSNSFLSLRINPEVGDGEFNGMVTGGEESKFGLLPKDLDNAEEILRIYNMKLVALHCHIGSGIYRVDKFAQAVAYMKKITLRFKPSQFVNFGGGLGVRYNETTPQVDVTAFGEIICQYLDSVSLQLGYKLSAIIEPGKFLVAESTCLLTTVTNIKINNDNLTFVGTDTGMNHVIRPALYSAHHSVINISNDEEKEECVTIVGNICESTDVIARNVTINRPSEGDILAVLTTGAYCSSMSSLYNMRPYAVEVMIDEEGQHKLIRKKIDLNTMTNGLGFIM